VVGIIKAIVNPIGSQQTQTGTQQNREPQCNKEYWSDFNGRYEYNVSCIAEFAAFSDNYRICEKTLIQPLKGASVAFYSNEQIASKISVCVFEMAKIANNSSLCEKLLCSDASPPGYTCGLMGQISQEDCYSHFSKTA